MEGFITDVHSASSDVRGNILSQLADSCASGKIFLFFLIKMKYKYMQQIYGGTSMNRLRKLLFAHFLATQWIRAY